MIVMKDTPNICVLCPTRWTVQAQTLHSIMEDYKSLLTLKVEDCMDSDFKARTLGVQTQMEMFVFF